MVKLTENWGAEHDYGIAELCGSGVAERNTRSSRGEKKACKSPPRPRLANKERKRWAVVWTGSSTVRHLHLQKC